MTEARFSAEDERHMRAALALAERGRGDTRPNPVVGAVIVRGGRVLARGHHRRAGLPHAEIEALALLGGRARGATMYVTLEPCCHVGRTGPCTDALIASGVRRVVVGCRDANPLVSGRGVARLRRAGIRVDVGCLEEQCLAANRAFFRWIRDGRPWVTLKAAATLDGIIAPGRAPRGRIHWITGEPARLAAHALRAEHDAVLVGVGTVRADDPRLTVRLPGVRRRPLRVVLDPDLSTPTGAAVLRGGGTLLVGTARRARRVQRRDATVRLVAAARDGRPRLGAVLRMLAAEFQVQSVLVEGGSRVLGAFVDAGLVDAVAWFVAPRLLGGGVAAVGGRGRPPGRALELGPLAVRAVGADLLVRADVIPPDR